MNWKPGSQPIYTFNNIGTHVLSFDSHFKMFLMFYFREMLSESPSCWQTSWRE